MSIKTSQSSFDLILTLDAGVSLNKVLWMAWPSGKAELLLMGSELLEVQLSNLLNFGLTGGSPAANAIVTLKNGRCLAFGEKAREMKGKPPANLSKYETTTYKLLAVLGAIAQTLNLPTDFTIALCAVLPYSEYQDSERFEELLRENLSSFTFQEQEYRVNLKLLDVKPEGAGIALIRREEDKVGFAASNVTVLMLGQRDASLLPFKKGAPQKGIGSRLGFEQFLENVKLMAALNLKSVDEAALTELVFRGQSEPRCIERIARMVVSSYELTHKVEQIDEAIEVCKQKHWHDLKTWLESSLGQSLYELDRVSVGGGAAMYWQPEIEAFFESEQISLSWGVGLDKVINTTLRQELSSILVFRLADPFGLFRLLIGKVKQADADAALALSGGASGKR